MSEEYGLSSLSLNAFNMEIGEYLELRKRIKKLSFDILGRKYTFMNGSILKIGLMQTSFVSSLNLYESYYLANSQ